MSLSETYLLASKARSKLQREASRGDHSLRVLVSHANMLDNIMDSLAQRKHAQQVEPISLSSPSAFNSNKTYNSSPLKSNSSEHNMSQYHVEVIEEVDDEDDEYYSDEYVSGFDGEHEEEEDEEDYSLFEECQLPPNHYQTTSNKTHYQILPSVKESPSEALHFEEHSSQQQGCFSHKASNPIIASVAVVEVSEDEENDGDEYDDEYDDDKVEYSCAYTISSLPAMEPPSLCYSESDSDDDDSSLLDSEEHEDEEQQHEIIKPLVHHQPFKRLLLPSPDQLDMMIH